MKSWLTTTDHKRIGLLYFFTAFAFFLMGGIEALVIRAQRLYRLPHDPRRLAGRHRTEPHARRQPDDDRERTLPQ